MAGPFGTAPWPLPGPVAILYRAAMAKEPSEPRSLTAAEQRAARLAKALRENLKRRKAQARGRGAGAAAGPAAAEPAGPSRADEQ